MKNTEKHGKSRYIGMNIRNMLKNQGNLQVIRNPLFNVLRISFITNSFTNNETSFLLPLSSSTQASLFLPVTAETATVVSIKNLSLVFLTYLRKKDRWLKEDALISV